MICLILWVLVGLVSAAIDIYLCKLDKERQTVKSLTKGALISVIFAPLAIYYTCAIREHPCLNC